MENNPYEPLASKKRSIHRGLFLVMEILFALILVMGASFAFFWVSPSKVEIGPKRWSGGVQNYESIPIEPQLPSPTSNP